MQDRFKTLVWRMANLRGAGLALVVAALALGSCDTLEPDPESVVDDVVVDDKVPLISLNVPSSLTETGSASASVNRFYKVTGPREDARDVFRPFRHSLGTARRMIEHANTIINRINEHDLPDTLDIVNARGERIVVTTDATREYAKRIEIYKPGGLKFMQANYNTDVVKVLVLFDPTAVDSAAGVTNISILYDASTNEPSLTGTMVFATEDDSTARRSHPKRLFVNLAGAGGQVAVQGGVVYNFNFGVGDSTAGNPRAYTADHAYMYQALADTGSGMALVNLFFPQATVNSPGLSGYEIGPVYLDMVTTWVNYPENTGVQGHFDQLIGAVPDSSFTYATTDDLKRMLEFIAANSGGAGLSGLLFLINLDNPVAYDATTGYVAHGDSVTTDFTALGSPGDAAFTLTPLEIAGLTVSFLTD